MRVNAKMEKVLKAAQANEGVSANQMNPQNWTAEDWAAVRRVEALAAAAGAAALAAGAANAEARAMADAAFPNLPALSPNDPVYNASNYPPPGLGNTRGRGAHRMVNRGFFPL
jgi:hypothetical protein